MKRENLSRSLAIQAALAKKVTAKQLEHEFDRFVSMSTKQMLVRINKMTSAVKLEACRMMAKDLGQVVIVRAARNRRNECYKA